MLTRFSSGRKLDKTREFNTERDESCFTYFQLNGLKKNFRPHPQIDCEPTLTPKELEQRKAILFQIPLYSPCAALTIRREQDPITTLPPPVRKTQWKLPLNGLSRSVSSPKAMGIPPQFSKTFDLPPATEVCSSSGAFLSDFSEFINYVPLLLQGLG